MRKALKTYSCSRCQHKCMKCGSQTDLPESQPDDGHHVPYRLCRHCMEEYLEFMRRLHGRGDTSLFWHNREWMELWKAWINYQEAFTRYELSEGFRRLVEELHNT
jgi:hypothetical protein